MLKCHFNLSGTNNYGKPRRQERSKLADLGQDWSSLVLVVVVTDWVAVNLYCYGDRINIISYAVMMKELPHGDE